MIIRIVRWEEVKVMKKWFNRIEGNEMRMFTFFSLFLLVIASFISGSPSEIINGIKVIITSRDALITDYFELAGYGAAFFNGVIVFGMGIAMIIFQRIPFTGLTLAALFISGGYALWGKNPVNILPILFGTTLYAWFHGARLNRYIYTALFGTCLAPLTTELVYLFPYSQAVNLFISIIVGVFIGFILPPLSMHTASMHMGYSLFNVGFSGGILVFVIVCILKALGMESKSVLIWGYGQSPAIVICLYLYFAITILFGLVIGKGKISEFKKLMKHSGRVVTDFVLMNGASATLINMGIVGMVCVTYIILIEGDFSGPVVGSILTAFGFSAFGVHIKNYLPVLFGVFISTFITKFAANTPGIQLAAIFAVGLAPIAGQFGMLAGICAGFLHAIIVMYTSEMYGGLNLYNNGFSAGWVAILMVPIIESFQKHLKERRKGS